VLRARTSAVLPESTWPKTPTFILAIIYAMIDFYKSRSMKKREEKEIFFTLYSQKEKKETVIHTHKCFEEL
jgi:hypothetical protein